MEIWSNSDYPYQCLLDSRRTTAFRTAIRAVVETGDVVLDAGAGSGILSFFAAQAGAKKVYAVEIDSFLASCLERSARANNFGDTVEVVHDDVHRARLPSGVDVFICEMMETGLMDERQVPAINGLREQGIVTDETRMIPFRYETFVELGFTQFTYYGCTVFAPKHDWPHYLDTDNGWLPTSFQPRSEPCRIDDLDLRRRIRSTVDSRRPIRIESGGAVNAIRISARAHLADGVVLGATNALNGDKVLAIDERAFVEGQVVRARVRYEMGRGLASFHVELSED